MWSEKTAFMHEQKNKMVNSKVECVTFIKARLDQNAETQDHRVKIALADEIFNFLIPNIWFLNAYPKFAKVTREKLIEFSRTPIYRHKAEHFYRALFGATLPTSPIESTLNQSRLNKPTRVEPTQPAQPTRVNKPAQPPQPPQRRPTNQPIPNPPALLPYFPSSLTYLPSLRDATVLATTHFSRVLQMPIEQKNYAFKVYTYNDEGTIRDLVFSSMFHHPNIHRFEKIGYAYGYPRTSGIASQSALADMNLDEFWQHKRSPLDEFPARPRLLRPILFQILRGLSHMHHMDIVHRDLKPQNILVFLNTETNSDKSAQTSPRIAITDFTHSNFLRSSSDSPPDYDMTTATYRAPELFEDNQHYTKACDMYSLGIVFWELMYFDEFPVFGTNIRDEFSSKKETKLFFNSRRGIRKLKNSNRYAWITPLLKDLVTRMLHPDPNQRITVREALQHNYFRKRAAVRRVKRELPVPKNADTNRDASNTRANPNSNHAKKWALAQLPAELRAAMDTEKFDHSSKKVWSQILDRYKHSSN